MPRAPLIAITATSRADGDTRRVRLGAAYVTAVEQAGGLPLILPPLSSVAGAEQLLDAADALLLTGGEDVSPDRYGAAPHPKLGDVNVARDATEIALVEIARQRALPTLAVCRGIQLVNVAFGGSLIQDIPSERPGTLDHDPGTPRAAGVHDVRVEPSSRLALAVGAPHLRVNSFHHQAADRVAEGLRATAWAPDGIIEGLEWDGSDWWMLAVQWHPEEMIGEEAEMGIFRAFVEEAKGRE
jgi:putative glutamine amidotransferase